MVILLVHARQSVASGSGCYVFVNYFSSVLFVVLCYCELMTRVSEGCFVDHWHKQGERTKKESADQLADLRGQDQAGAYAYHPIEQDEKDLTLTRRRTVRRQPCQFPWRSWFPHCKKKKKKS